MKVTNIFIFQTKKFLPWSIKNLSEFCSDDFSKIIVERFLINQSLFQERRSLKRHSNYLKLNN